jgi:ketosteroid isomerase-like protein
MAHDEDMLRHLLPLLLLALVQTPPSPESGVEELLQADRSFSSAGAQKDTLSALSAMFAEDVIAGVPGGTFADSREKLIEALKGNLDNSTSRVEWAPIRGGISADGRHGFTFGYMTVHKKDGSRAPWKYLAYWIKGPQGWRVAAYRRRPRPEGSVSMAMMPPSLPARMVAPSSDPAVIEQHRQSLAAAEQAFSDEAQKIGLAAAFTKYGRADAINMGGPKDIAFVVGSPNIGRSVGQGTPTDSSPVVWGPDHKVLVASSGDLGITFGFIRSTTAKDQPPAPFFTIWRRVSSTEPWRYIAE